MSNWKTVADRMRRRREELGLTIPQASERAGISAPQWDVMENARRDSFRTRSLRGVERALSWHPGSIDALLAGADIYEPAPEVVTTRDQPEDTDLDTLTNLLKPATVVLLKRVLLDMFARDFIGERTSWRLDVLHQLYELDEDAFDDWVIEKLIRSADDDGGAEMAVSRVQQLVDDYVAGLELHFAETYDPADFALAAQDDEDGVLDGRTETPVEENPEV